VEGCELGLSPFTAWGPINVQGMIGLLKVFEATGLWAGNSQRALRIMKLQNPPAAIAEDRTRSFG